MTIIGIQYDFIDVTYYPDKNTLGHLLWGRQGGITMFYAEMPQSIREQGGMFWTPHITHEYLELPDGSYMTYQHREYGSGVYQLVLLRDR